MKFKAIISVIWTAAAALLLGSCQKDNTGNGASVKLVPEMISSVEGVEDFDAEAGLMTISAGALQCSSIKFSNADGNLDGIKLTATSVDKTWCVARMSSSFLSLTIVENRSEAARQTVVTVGAEMDGKVLDSYDLLIVQNGKKKEPVIDDSKSKAEMLQFMIQGQVSCQISSTLISVVMPTGTDVTKLIAVYEISKGAVCTPANASTTDFTQPVTYTVVSADGKVTNQYIVVVSCQKESSGGETGGSLTRNPQYKKFDYVNVGAGSFMLGVDPAGRWKPLTNYHKVNISALQVGRYEVTQAEFLEIMGYNPSVNQIDEQQPVHKVTLYEAMLYCNKLSERDGFDKVYTFSDEVWGDVNGHKELYRATVGRNEKANGWRLPTSAEWEYVAKGGPEQQPYCYPGSNDPDEICWHEENSLIGEKPTLHCVGTKKPNTLGIYDLSGNIDEYTGEWYWTLDYISDAEETDPWGFPTPTTTSTTGDNLVFCRGGNYNSYAASGYITNRRLLNGNIKNDSYFPGGETWWGHIGFRVYRYQETRK